MSTFQTALQQGIASAAVLGLILIVSSLSFIGVLAHYVLSNWTEINEDKDRNLVFVCLLFMFCIALFVLVFGTVQMFTLEYAACSALKTCLP